MMRIHVVTLFPDFFRGPLGLSIPARAAAAGLVEYDLVDLRRFAHDKHGTVDDYPFGGGAGMVMKPGPFFEAVQSVAPEGEDRPQGPILLMSARGRRFTHEDAVRLSLAPELTLLCGHYKDVDQRVAEGLATEEVCLGDFIVSGGEIPALAVVDAVVRLLPGAISDHESASSDSFYDGTLSPPSYTRPAEYRGMKVPPVLLSGDHARIAAWRREQSERLTRERRPELQPERPEHS
ncbi:MAG TPA: tRNA (guanosine(37)-N1)-methyltransferase TrmD [Longimicrobiaceae bacterium]|jgi:tRNA (guanine37-N1)-methyltransferase|nr:tRNA (guanosine(37)-N1)-methyltransferase TrmD [Longimicrobiaceae bacterium]